jgi:hypothetical protein
MVILNHGEFFREASWFKVTEKIRFYSHLLENLPRTALVQENREILLGSEELNREVRLKHFFAWYPYREGFILAYLANALSDFLHF